MIRSRRLTSWRLAPDGENRGIRRGWTAAVPDEARETTVPSIVQQVFPGAHGVAFYWTEFSCELDGAGTDALLLRFGGVDYKADVWLNGIYLGGNEGGEVPFDFDITGSVRRTGSNLLAVRVLNPVEEKIDGIDLAGAASRNKTVRRRGGSSLNHGGIWYGVTLERVPGTYLADCHLSGDWKSGRLTARVEAVNRSDGPAEAALELRVYEKTGGEALVAEERVPVRLGPGRTGAACSVRVPEHRLWDVDDPVLYRVETALVSELGRHAVIRNFGFKDFRVTDGYFRLNGRRIFVRSAHSGNAFPAGQMLPAVPSMTVQDFYYAKACGFNMLRSIAGLFRPEQLDFCDEIGLLVYEECLASWMLGGGEPQPDEPDLVCGRFDRCTEAMIRRDRSHACVAVWGLLNETPDGVVFRRAEAFLPRARALDPDRLILLNSGRWDEDPSVGSLSNPGSAVWERQWGGEGTARGDAEDRAGRIPAARPGDLHSYPVSPLSAGDVRFLRTVGTGTKPVFLSEFGEGALFDVIDEWRRFCQDGRRPDLEDAAWVRYQSEALERDWARFGLASVWPSAEMMLRESQRLNADVRRRDLDIVRSNPRLCGYSLTGLLDHGMCGEGLWTYWRRFKPEMFDAISDGWAPLRFCLFARPHIFADEPPKLEAVLANDGVLPAGARFTAEFSVVGRNGTEAAWTADFSVPADELAFPVDERTLPAGLPAGEYEFRAFLRDGASPAGNALRFTVTDRSSIRFETRSVRGVGLAERTRSFLTEKGVAAADGPAEDGVILAGEGIDGESLARILAAVERGAKAVLLSAEPFRSGRLDVSLLGIDGLRIEDIRDWLYHKECVVTPGTVFDGFAVGLADYPHFGQTFPHPAYALDAVPDHVICPAFHTGSYAIPDGYGAFHVICGFDRGAGVLILNCFDLENTLDDEPAAGLLLRNLTEYAAGL